MYTGGVLPRALEHRVCGVSASRRVPEEVLEKSRLQGPDTAVSRRGAELKMRPRLCSVQFPLCRLIGGSVDIFCFLHM